MLAHGHVMEVGATVAHGGHARENRADTGGTRGAGVFGHKVMSNGLLP